MVFSEGGRKKCKNWTINGMEIEQVAHLKYLAVTFSHNLAWKTNISSAQKIAKVDINGLVCFFCSKVGNIYLQLLRPLMLRYSLKFYMAQASRSMVSETSLISTLLCLQQIAGIRVEETALRMEFTQSLLEHRLCAFKLSSTPWLFAFKLRLKSFFQHQTPMGIFYIFWGKTFATVPGLHW